MGKRKGKLSSEQKRRQRRLDKLEKEGNNNNSEVDSDLVEENENQKDSDLEENDEEKMSSKRNEGASGQLPVRKKSRRQSGEIIWESDHFPPCSKFQPPSKLPTIKSVVGRVRYLTMGGKHQERKDMAIKQVAMEVESKYYHDTVYCMPIRTILRKLENVMSIYKNGKARLLEGNRDSAKVVQEYKDLILEKDKLFEVATSSPEQRTKCELSWGVKMGDKEKLYLADQRGTENWSVIWG